MFESLGKVVDRYEELGRLLSDEKVIKDRKEFIRLSREYAEVGRVVGAYNKYKKTEQELADSKELLLDKDPEVRELAGQEVAELEARLEREENELNELLLPKDPRDDKNTFIEIRAGTGGEEAGLFAADLLRMYVRFAERRNWTTEIISSTQTDLGGFKEVVLLVKGEQVYSRLKYEGGVHRVQRVPETEAQGRIHTSAVTVAVMPEADEVELDIDEKDLKIDVFRSSGPGGQSVNTTDSAVRITHLPTNTVVICQDEKSQHKNKAKAMKVLRARLMDRLTRERDREMAEERRIMVGSGDRSERIRTYNFPQGRVTDHRIGLTLYKLDQVLDGDLEPVIEPLALHFRAKSLRAGESDNGRSD
ncbi:MAG: peptide chain release factor 1 [Deltaproteobacteria bacterium]|nr:peptide chain release factor 1 [Deltaproteobacteria bacterium]